MVAARQGPTRGGGRVRWRLARAARGFTLIEILVVLSLVAILALAALPNMTDRVVRDQVGEALKLADVAKPSVEAAWRAGLDLPADNDAADIPPAEKIVGSFVRSVELEDGAIHITLGNQVNGAVAGRRLTLRPAVVDDAPQVPVAWVCGWSDVPQPMQARGTNRTDLENRYLPVGCRGEGGREGAR